MTDMTQADQEQLLLDLQEVYAGHAAAYAELKASGLLDQPCASILDLDERRELHRLIETALSEIRETLEWLALPESE